MDDERDGAESDPGGHPLPGGRCDARRDPGEAEQRGRADPVDGEAGNDDRSESLERNVGGSLSGRTSCWSSAPSDITTYS